MRTLMLLAAALLLAGCAEEGGGAPTPATSGTGTTPTPTIMPGGTPTPTTPTTTSPTPSSPPLASPVENRTLDVGPQTEHREPARVVATNEAEWLALWERHAPGSTPPEVDLSRETVLAAFLGPKSDGCWAVRISAIRDDGAGGGAAVAEVTTYRAPADMACTQAITYPYHIVAAEGADRSVTWVERNETMVPPESE